MWSTVATLRIYSNDDTYFRVLTRFYGKYWRSIIGINKKQTVIQRRRQNSRKRAHLRIDFNDNTYFRVFALILQRSWRSIVGINYKNKVIKQDKNFLKAGRSRKRHGGHEPLRVHGLQRVERRHKTGHRRHGRHRHGQKRCGVGGDGGGIRCCGRFGIGMESCGSRRSRCMRSGWRR